MREDIIKYEPLYNAGASARRSKDPASMHGVAVYRVLNAKHTMIRKVF